MAWKFAYDQSQVIRYSCLLFERSRPEALFQMDCGEKNIQATTPYHTRALALNVELTSRQLCLLKVHLKLYWFLVARQQMFLCGIRIWVSVTSEGVEQSWCT
jgi:hypothetical protein